MTTTQNSQNDRIIARITILKDQSNLKQFKTQQRKATPLNFTRAHDHSNMAGLVYQHQNHNMQSITENKQDSGMSLGKCDEGNYQN